MGTKVFILPSNKELQNKTVIDHVSPARETTLFNGIIQRHKGCKLIQSLGDNSAIPIKSSIPSNITLVNRKKNFM